MQPYVAQHYNLSPVFLPVKSDNNKNNSSSRTRPSHRVLDKPKVAKNSTSRKQNLEKEKGIAVINPPRIGQVKGETKRAYSAKKCQLNSDGNKKGNASSSSTTSSSGASSSTSTLTDQHEDSNKEQEGSGESEAAFQKQQQQNHSRTEMSNISLYINWLSEEEESPEATRISVENQELQETRCSNSQKESNLSSGISSSTAAAVNIGNKSKNNSNNNNKKNIVKQERAEALESLLELCAKLLKREKLEELAGVLKPFEDEEEEGVSSRETAIWLTKGLIDIHKESATV